VGWNPPDNRDSEHEGVVQNKEIIIKIKNKNKNFTTTATTAAAVVNRDYFLFIYLFFKLLRRGPAV